MATDQTAQIDWRDGGVPVSARFDDPYYSIQNGLEETRHVFLVGNGLPARFRDGFVIAELGFGTGLNLLASWEAWEQAGAQGNLHFTSFEAYPMTAPDMAQALTAFPHLTPKAQALTDAWQGGNRNFTLGPVTVQVIVGDARQNLPAWTGHADAWFLDGFSPAKNPELWDPALMTEVGRHTAHDGSFATYTAAGHVRRALENAGFRVERRPGFGRKRHMTTGQMEPTS